MEEPESEHFIEVSALEAIRGKPFLYAAAGSDLEQPIVALTGHVHDFTFVDINYGIARMRRALEPSTSFLFRGQRKEIPEVAGETHTGNQCGRQVVHPFIKVEEYDLLNGDSISVRRRCGYGQYAIAALDPGSLGVFMHRGDSGGEGGSGILFLSDNANDHKPSENLLTLLKTKLAPQALIIADASTTPSWLKSPFNGDSGREGDEIYFNLRGWEYNQPDCVWRCVGYLPPRYRRPCLVWLCTKRG